MLGFRQYSAWGLSVNSNSSGIKFKGISFFSGMRTPMIPEYIGIVNFLIFDPVLMNERYAPASTGSPAPFLSTSGKSVITSSMVTKFYSL